MQIDSPIESPPILEKAEDAEVSDESTTAVASADESVSFFSILLLFLEYRRNIILAGSRSRRKSWSNRRDFDKRPRLRRTGKAFFVHVKQMKFPASGR